MNASYKHIFILTGAGISAESGIKTFRDHNGLWENHPVEQVASLKGFQTNPELVYRFYNLRRAQLKEVKPNAAHVAIAKLQNNFQGKVTLVTQNVDDLHERAGSRDVYHMHGEIKKVRCLTTGRVFEWTASLDAKDSCPCCHMAGNLRPHIVWFGEIPLHMNKIEKALQSCDLFICVGTSGVVYPAAGFVNLAKDHGAYAIECNKEQTANGHFFERSIIGPASQSIPSLVEEILLDIHKLSQ